jgi:hypothetical protein
MKVNITDPKQNIFDIALIGSGAAEGAFAIAYKYRQSVTDAIPFGEQGDVEVLNRRIVDFFAAEKHKPASGDLIAEGVFDNSFDNIFS